MSGSNALTIPRDPTVLVNPLAAMDAGTQSAGLVYDLRQKQANEAAGQAYQGAVNPQTGEFDPNEFRRRLAASGPAAMAAGAALMNTQQISSDQLKQSLEKQKWINSTAGALLQSGDFSDAAMLGALHNGVAGSILTLPEAQRQLATMPADAAGRQRWLQEHQDTSASFAEQMQQRFGTRETITTPQGTYNTQIPPPRANAPTIVTPHGPTPGNTTTKIVPVDDQGIIPQDANGVPLRTPKTWQPMTVPVTAVPGVPQGGPPQAMPAPGSTPAAAPPGALPPGSPPPPPGTRLQGGRFVTTPPAATPPPAAVPPTATPPAPVVATKPPVFTSPPQGQPEKLKADVEAYTTDQAAYPNVQTRAQNMAHAYDALNQLKSTTGKGAAGIQTLRSWAQTLGIAPQGTVDEATLMDLVTKYTTRAMIDAAGGGSTDLGKKLQEESNAGTLLTKGANFEVLRNDMGKALQTMAAYKNQQDTSGVGYLKGRADLADSTDPRGFVWDLYSDPEKAKINAEVAGNKVAADKLHKAMGMAGRLNLQIPGLTPPPAVPQKQSFLAPPQPASNPLMMTG